MFMISSNISLSLILLLQLHLKQYKKRAFGPLYNIIFYIYYYLLFLARSFIFDNRREEVKVRVKTHGLLVLVS